MSTAKRHRCAFLDRDGVICLERGYVHRREDFAFVPGALEGMRLLQQQGFLLAIVTNQSGIARGYYTEQAYHDLTAHMMSEFVAAGVVVAGIRHCPHLPDAAVANYRQDCTCRKPAPGMIVSLAQALDLDLAHSLMVGDKVSDVQAGRAAGVGRCMLVRSGHPFSAADGALADDVFDDLLTCALAVARPDTCASQPLAPQPTASTTPCSH